LKLSESESSDYLVKERGLAKTSTKPRFLVIGRVVKPHGIRGEVAVEILTDLPERYTWLETIYLGTDTPRPVALQGVRFHKTRVLLKLDGYDDRNAADTLRGQWLQVPEADAVPLDEDEYYLYQLIGLKVFEEDEGYLGTLTEILETKANNVFIVNGPAGEILVPDISQVIRDINFENGRLVVRLLPGLRPE